MKRILTMAAAAMLLVSCNNSKTNQNNTEMKQTVGQFQAYELDGFRLHVYNSNDVMADACSDGVSTFQSECQGVF